MKGMRPATQFLGCWLLAAGVASAQTPTIDLRQSAGRAAIDSHVAGAGLGESVHYGDVTGDFWNKELLLGTPDESGARGAMRVLQRNRTSLSDAIAVLTGGAAGDRFGAAADAGFVIHEEVLVVNGNPVPPLRPRDLVVGAPGAFGGRGAVYVFPGPLASGTRTPADAAFTIIGALPGDDLGTVLETADLNNDGYREIVVAATGRNLIYIIDVHNTIGTTGPTLDLATSAPLTVVSGLSGTPAIATGDVTGDRIFDLALGDPDAYGTRGAVYLITGRDDGGFPAALDLSAGPLPRFIGADVGDQVGASLWIADIDDDADPTAELLVGAPGGDGPGNARADAGEVHVLWGGPGLVSAFGPALTFYGAAAGDRLGTLVSAGQITRRTPADVAMFAPGAGGAGEVFIYFGRERWAYPAGPLDMTVSTDRRVIAAGGAAVSMLVWEFTGEGAEEVLLGYPGQETDAGEGAGRIYVGLSPTIDPSARSVSLSVMQGRSASFSLTVTNFSAIPVSVRGTSPAAWLTAGPDLISSRVDVPGTLSVVVNAVSLSPGEHQGVLNLSSATWDLAMTVPVTVSLRVLASPVLAASFTESTSAPIGEPITWTATADTSAGPVEYLFRRYSLETGWTVVQNYSSSNSFTWTPGDSDSGRYVMEVWVRAVGSSMVFEAQASTGFFAVGDATPLFVFSQNIDFDGDDRADLAVYRPSNGTWYALLSSAQYGASLSRNWGVSTDIPVPGDYDGDGRTDFAVFRPSNGTWYVLLSSHGYGASLVRQWGLSTDIPVPGDYDGDGRTDFAVFRPSNGTWYVLLSSHGYGASLVRQWGLSTDIPVPGDYDGDGRTDFAVYRPSNGTWYALESSTGFGTAVQRQWGLATDRPVAGDYDGDGRTDFAVFRPSTGTWYSLLSSTGFGAAITRQWGVATDVPVPGDFNGDRRTDIAVFRPGTGTWFVWNQFSRAWGIATDIPLLMR